MIKITKLSEFKKDMLENGDVIVLNNDTKFVLVDRCLVSNDGEIDISVFDESLVYKHNKNVFVEKIETYAEMSRGFFNVLQNKKFKPEIVKIKEDWISKWLESKEDDVVEVIDKNFNTHRLHIHECKKFDDGSMLLSLHAFGRSSKTNTMKSYQHIAFNKEGEPNFKVNEYRNVKLLKGDC